MFVSLQGQYNRIPAPILQRSARNEDKVINILTYEEVTNTGVVNLQNMHYQSAYYPHWMREFENQHQWRVIVRSSILRDKIIIFRIFFILKVKYISIPKAMICQVNWKLFRQSSEIIQKISIQREGLKESAYFYGQLDLLV